MFRTPELTSEELLNNVNSYAVSMAKTKEISDTKLGRELNGLMKEDCGVTKERQVGGDRRVFYSFDAEKFAKHAVAQGWLEPEEQEFVAQRAKPTVPTLGNRGTR